MPLPGKWNILLRCGTSVLCGFLAGAAAVSCVGPRCAAGAAMRDLSAVWQSVRKVRHVDPDDRFFDLGGDSLLSIEVMLQAKHHGWDVSLQQILQHQTLRALAQHARRLPSVRPAVRAGGGTNPRMGLYDGVLVKDTHIAAWSRPIGNSSLAEAVKQTRESAPGRSIEVEVDTLDQLQDVLIGHPDIVLLDNMTTDQLREAIQIRDSSAPDVLLEASGGISLQTVRGVAETGVNRISVGALTHSVPNFDLGFDFHRVA